MPISAAPAPVSKGAPLRVSLPNHSGTASTARITANASQLGLVDRDQAKHEARAKIIWGNSKDSVIQYLMVQGYTVEEASETVNSFYQERVASVRANGFKQIFIGIGFQSVPVIALLVYLLGHGPGRRTLGIPENTQRHDSRHSSENPIRGHRRTIKRFRPATEPPHSESV
jgi:hypothetical protein